MGPLTIAPPAMFRGGYNGTSVRDIVAAAGVPQGSFTNHFRTKEAFAAALTRSVDRGAVEGRPAHSTQVGRRKNQRHGRHTAMRWFSCARQTLA
jgi:TetR/AcrR family transcriptional repressor of nem operon